MRKLEFGLKSLAHVLPGLLLTFAISCVNENYDLDKEIDMNVTLFKNVALPVGNVEKICLKDVLFGEDASFLTESEDGNYSLEFVSGSFSDELTVPSYEFDGFSSSANLSLPVSGSGTVMLPDGLSGTIDMGTMSFEWGMHSDKFPKAITGLYSCDVSAGLVLSLASSSASGSLSLTAGSTVVFPDFLILGDYVPAGMKKTGHNRYELSDDISLSPSKEFKFIISGLDFRALPSGQGLVRPGSISIDAEISVSGNIRFDLSAASSVNLYGTLRTENIILKSAEASINMETDIRLSPFDVSGVPDFLRNENSVLDLRGLRLDMSVYNSFPAGGTISSGIRTLRNSYPLAEATLGPVHFSADSGHGENAFSFSQEGKGAQNGWSDVRTDNFDRLLRVIPDAVQLYDFKAVTDNEPVCVNFGFPYNIDVSYSFGCPLCFGNDMNIDFSQDITGLGIDLSDYSLTSAQLSLDAVNSIPMDFSITAVAIDESGNELTDVNVSLDADILAGTIESPVRSALVLELSSSASIAFDGLRLSMKAVSGSSADACMPLNSGQGLELKGLVLRLPEGISFNLNETDDND